MIIDKLHKQFPNLDELRMREIRVDRQQRKVFCTLSHPRALDFDANLKKEIADTISAELPQGYACSIKYAQDDFTVVSFQKLLVELIKKQYPIYANISRNKIEVIVTGRSINVVFVVSEVVKKNMEISEFCEKLTSYFQEYTSYDVNFALKLDELSTASVNVSEQEKLVQLAINRELLKPSRHFSITNVKKYIGKEIISMPMYILDAKKPMDSCVLCGTISAKTVRAAKNNPLLHVCSFTLTDGTGNSMPCILFVRLQITDVETIMNETGKGEAEAKTLSQTRGFANDKKLKQLTLLADGTSVAVRGKVAYNQNGERLEMVVYDLCKCKIDTISHSSEASRKVADEYLLVKPEDSSEYRQINFVDNSSKKSLLTGKSYVVLHVNTTGYNVIEDKIYAICAVKLVDGHVTERFFTYVNPECDVDKKSLELCGLSQSKFIFHPTITEIISDLYKFTYGCRLVGNNLRQIVDMLNYYATPVGYRFTNGTDNQVELLGALFENSILNVSVNLAKLDDVAKKCKVECPSTVFCADTALTVARCMSVLSYNSK